jgi:hypothetical protein
MVAGGSGGFGVIKVDKLKKVGLQSLLFGIHRCAPVKLQHWSANVVIITADTLTKNFGIHRCCRRISPMQ